MKKEFVCFNAKQTSKPWRLCERVHSDNTILSTFLATLRDGSKQMIPVKIYSQHIEIATQISLNNNGSSLHV